MPMNALVMDRKDNVATALCHLENGDSIRVEIEDSDVDVLLLQSILRSSIQDRRTSMEA